MTSPIALELHYYLQGESHSLDAMIRNKCESELLALFFEVAENLGIPIHIEAEAFEAGGLKEFWRWLGVNSPQLAVTLSLISIIIVLAPDLDTEKNRLEKELTTLNIKEKKLEIEKLRKELREITPQTEGSIRESAVHLLIRNPKIVVRRSNFYKQLLGYEKVEGIGITPIDFEYHPTEDERKIPKTKFGQFVLRTHVLSPLVIEDAKIEIISPVLREGSYQWKGIFRDKPTGFSMRDDEFRGLVLREEITFQHGTFIDCVLNINRKLDEVGEVEITGYTVTTVIRKYDDRQSVETRQGRAYNHAKKLRRSQRDMFDDG